MAFDRVIPPGDYYAPQYKVRFYSPRAEVTLNERGVPVAASGETPTATLSSDDPDGIDNTIYAENPEATKLRAYVNSIVIEGVSSSAFKATVTLSAPYDDAAKILDNKVIRFGSIMTIEWGYFVGSRVITSPIHAFQITQPSAKFGLTTDITIAGNDLHSAIAADRAKARTWLRTEFPTDLDILKGIVGELKTGMTINAAQVPAESTIRQTGNGEGRDQSESYLRFFRRICNDHKLGWRIFKDEIVLFDMDAVARQDPHYVLLWRRKPTEENHIPIKDITINPLLSLFQGLSGTRGIHQSAPNLDTGETTQRVVSDVNVPGHANPTDSAQTAAAPVTNTPARSNTPAGQLSGSPTMPDGSSGDRVPTTSRATNPNGQVNTAVTNTSALVNTTAQVTIPGHPAIAPQMIVDIQGLPEIFAGKYLIKSVKHTIGDGYTTELQLFSRVSSQDPRGAGQRSNAQTNTSEAKPANGEQPTPLDADGVAAAVSGIAGRLFGGF